MQIRYIAFALTLILFMLGNTVLAGTCGGAVQCQPGDTLTSDHVMWYDMTDCSGEYGLVILADGLTLNGNGHTIDGTDGDPSSGLWISYANHVTITNLTLTDFDNGIKMADSDTCVISANVMTSCYTGISILRGIDNRVTGNTIEGNTLTGVYAYENVASRFAQNSISNNSWRGIDLRGTTEFNMIWGNSFSGNPTNATGQADAINNDWSICGIGNYWDDFESNTGYPNEYVIEGSGSGTDYYPQVTSPVIAPTNALPNAPAVDALTCTPPEVLFYEMAMDESSINTNTVKPRGQLTGEWDVTALSYQDIGDQDLLDCVFDADPFAGELITVNLTHGINCEDGGYFPGFQWQYMAEVSPISPGMFEVHGPGTVPGDIHNRCAQASGDFNSDGFLDLAVTMTSADSVVVLLGDGDGTFSYGWGAETGDGPAGIVTADFNNDGDLDIATANYYGGNVSILFGDGNGWFPSESPLAVGQNPATLCTADFDNDGDLDLAIANSTDDNLTILFGDGSGSFSSSTVVPTGELPWSPVAGDLNGDGIIDLAICCANDYDVSVMIGNGDGSFTAAPSIAVGAAPYYLAPGDFNGDHDLDLAVTNTGSASVIILLGEGDGTFAVETPISVPALPEEIVSGDWNGDGNLDLAIASFMTPQISILEGQGDGSFVVENMTIPDQAKWVSAGDMDNDDDLDLVFVVDAESDNLWLLMNECSGSAGVTAVEPAAGTADVDVDLASFSNLITTHTYPNLNTLTVNDTTYQVRSCWRGNYAGYIDGTTFDPDSDFFYGEHVTVTMTNDVLGLGGECFDGYTWQFTTEVPSSCTGEFELYQGHSTGASPRAMTAIDYDSDLDIDLAVACRDGNVIWLFENINDSVLQWSSTLWSGDYPTAVVSCDFGNDGDPDMAASNFNNNEVKLYLNAGGTMITVVNTVPVGDGPTSLCAGDFDLDGEIDLATSNSTGGTISVLLNQGGLSFADAVTYVAAPVSRSIAAADLNNDGDLELITANKTDGNIAIFPNDGMGVFDTPLFTDAGSEPIGLAIGDYDTDGYLDIATCNVSVDSVSVLYGYGNGVFTAPYQYAAGNQPLELVSGDFDGDGDLDLAVSGYISDDVSVLVNQGSRSFAPAASQDATLNSAFGLAAADFDGDHDLDLAVAHLDDDLVTILHNINSSGCCAIRGDVDHNGAPEPNIADLVFMVTYMFQAGPPPPCDDPYSPDCAEHYFAEADVDGDGSCVPNIADLVYLVTYMFQDGPAPMPCP